MKYLAFIWADGMPLPEELAVMQRELPGYIEDMNSRGVRLFGRELDLPETAAVVRVRDGETLVTDGPFAETKEFIAGFDVFECADLDEAIEVAAKSPVSWFQALELRPVSAGLQLTEAAFAFGRGQDDATPYLLNVWAGGALAAPPGEQALRERCEAWRLDLQARGLHVLGHTLGDAETATTVRVRDGVTLLSDGPYGSTQAFITDFEVVSCASRSEAIELAATHPFARQHPIEVRPFWQG
jgi:hypothetical protein